MQGTYHIPTLPHFPIPIYSHQGKYQTNYLFIPRPIIRGFHFISILWWITPTHIINLQL